MSADVCYRGLRVKGRHYVWKELWEGGGFKYPAHDLKEIEPPQEVRHLQKVGIKGMSLFGWGTTRSIGGGILAEALLIDAVGPDLAKKYRSIFTNTQVNDFPAEWHVWQGTLQVWVDTLEKTQEGE